MKPEDLLARVLKVVADEVEFLLDEDRTDISFEDVERLARAEGIHVASVVQMFKEWGVHVRPRPTVKNVRGVTSNPNTRWASCPSHGGSGWEVISGFAGKEG